jgi:hypothetical protein
MARFRTPRRWLALAAATTGAVALASPLTSSAQTVPTTTRTTSRTTPYTSYNAGFTDDVTAGSVISVRASGQLTSLTELRAQICQGSLCATEAPSPDADALVVVKVDYEYTISLNFRVGIGTFRTATGETFVCDPTHSCQLAVHATQFIGENPGVRYTLTYAAPTTTTTTTTTTTMTTTTTTRPAAALCAARNRIPAWVWKLLVDIFGLAC